MSIVNRIALLTLHGKLEQIAPVFAKSLNAIVELTTQFDTDTLGTFTGEPPRLKSPEECALEKAQLAIKLTGLNAGLGSEGSFGPGPYGFGTFNRELIAYVDAINGYQVIGHFTGPIIVKTIDVKQREDAKVFLDEVPKNQGLVLQLTDDLSKVKKGLTVDDVQNELEQWLKQGTVRLSYDLRAHQCPARQVHISKAASNLVERLLCVCPACQAPGFWPDRYETGLPCELCHTATNKIKTRIAQCGHCDHTQMNPVAEAYAQPDFCPRCNP